jgi:hypothetical protein
MAGEFEPLFDPQEVPDMQILLLTRIYDILLADFMLRNNDEGIKLYDLHKAGGLLSPDLILNPDNIVR